MDDKTKRPLFTSPVTVGLACFLIISLCSVQSIKANNVVTFQQSVGNVVGQNDLDMHSLRKRRDVTDLESEADNPAKCEEQKNNFQALRDKLQKGERRLETTVSNVC